MNDSQAKVIYDSIVAQGDKLFPNTFILPNTDSRGGQSKSGAGSIGYDDMLCGDGEVRGIFKFGTGSTVASGQLQKLAGCSRQLASTTCGLPSHQSRKCIACIPKLGEWITH